MGRQEVHELVRKAGMEAQRSREGLKKVPVKTKDLVRTLPDEELEAAHSTLSNTLGFKGRRLTGFWASSQEL